MQKPRQKARVARVLSYGKSHGKDSRKLTLCIITFGFVLIASLSILQVRSAIGGKRGDQLSVNSSNGGRVWKGKLWLGGDGVQRMERKRGNNQGSEIISGTGGDPIKSSEDQEASEDDEGDRFEDLENEMDMEDEEGEDSEDFGGGGNAEWPHHGREKRLLVETEKNGVAVREQVTVGKDGEDAGRRMEGAGTVEPHQLDAEAVNSSDSMKGVGAGLPLLRKVASAKEYQGNLGLFNSDDESIDEETRERLEHISNIEDVLMLSKKDENHPNKEQGQKVSSDPLNPDNNPVLQDADSLGQDGDGLIKSDWAFKLSSPTAHSSFEDQKSPDVRVEDDSKEGPRSPLMTVFADAHNESATELSSQNESRIRKVSEGLESLKGQSEPSDIRHSEEEASSETLSDVSKTEESRKTRQKKGERKVQKVDMRGWGYVPGYRPDISFTNFMQEFLFDEKCSLRVFMAWMTPPWSFTVRHQRVLESLLYFHPTACVVVFSDTMELGFFKSFTDEGYRIVTVVPALEELLQNTPMDVFATIYYEWRTVDLFCLHYTELLRLGALYKYGGIYLDFDMIVLKPLTTLKNTVGSEVLESGQIRPNGAIMVFEKFSSFLNRSMVEFTATYDETLRDWNGADLLDRVMKLQPEGTDLNLAILDKPQVKPPSSFFPLSSEDISRYFIAPENSTAIAEELELFNRILSQSFAVHLWNGLTFNRMPEPGSLVDKLMGRYCLHCTDIL